MCATPYNIPEKTVERLSEYRRTLMRCHAEGITNIYSHVLADIHGFTAVQVRSDLMLIGFSGDKKKGYDVRALADFISGILDSAEPMNVAMIGMGHMAHAITKFFNDRHKTLRIVVSFDVDPEKVGQILGGIPCRHTDTFIETVRMMGIRIAVLAVPSHTAPNYVAPITEGGIRGVFNFTSAPLSFPDGVFVENVDVTTALEKLAYRVKESDGTAIACEVADTGDVADVTDVTDIPDPQDRNY